MCLADGREIKFVFRIVCMNEVVGNLVRQREIPGNVGLAEIVSLDIAIVPGFVIS